MEGQAPYPDAQDLRDLVVAHELLAALGIPAGPGGYDVDTLAAAVYAHGWRYAIDRTAGGTGFRAELRPSRGMTQVPAGFGVGWEPEVALAFALAQALERSEADAAPAQSAGHR
ncbi:MAG: hypothetical protein M3Q10_18215 [Chloroflexota bacterium]|nr:hypothetical protein [Chloroflexota bacterium]